MNLYIVATPIGNYQDITYRAIETLTNVDLILCEDTRVTGKLLKHYNIKKSMTCYNDHSSENFREFVLAKLLEGKNIALVSDAGTPLISDPGYKLVRYLKENHVNIITIPGASAVISALTISAQPTDSFYFAGFLPNKTLSRQKELSKLKFLDTTLVFYESPRRVLDSLTDMSKILGLDRAASIIREITKTYEEVKIGTLQELVEYYQVQPKILGEFVIVIAPPQNEIPVDIDELLRDLLTEMSVRDAANKASELTGKFKGEVYRRAVELKNSLD